jgi:hypothetical protein
MLTLSLGGTNPVPPKTCRGTIENPAAAAAVFPKNSRRETRLIDESFNRFNAPISHLAAAILQLLQQHVDNSLRTATGALALGAPCLAPRALGLVSANLADGQPANQRLF